MYLFITPVYYRKNNVRRSQWIDTINNAASGINTHMLGTMLKQGGFGKSSWQERFCICAGKDFDYFESPTENQPKGSISMIGSKIREFTLKDQKYCIEIISAGGGKKSSKKYSFACSSAENRTKWMTQFRKATNHVPRMLNGGNANDIVSPVHAGRGGDDGGLFGAPPEKRGHLMKKSPSLFKGYQKRYFVICEPGDMRYYETVS